MAVFETSRISFLKLLQLLLTCACVGLHYHSFVNLKVENLFVETGTYTGYLVVLVGVYAGYIFAMPISKRIDIFYSVAGCALFIASGALAIKAFKDTPKSELHDIGLAKGALAVINGLVFAIDAIIGFRSGS